MNGIEKDIDNLGRVVIPMKFRKKLGLEGSSKVVVSMEEGVILLSPTVRCCALCGEKITSLRKLQLCDCCISKVKQEM